MGASVVWSYRESLFRFAIRLRILRLLAHTWAITIIVFLHLSQSFFLRKFKAVCHTRLTNDLIAGHAMLIGCTFDELITFLITGNNAMFATSVLCVALLASLSKLLAKFSPLLA